MTYHASDSRSASPELPVRSLVEHRVQRLTSPHLLRYRQQVSDHPGEYRESDKIHVWGWDEINWFIKQPELYRNEWLEYAYKWVRDTDENGYFQLPLRRFEHYSASMMTKKGMRQEETIKKVWEMSDNL